MLDVLPLFTIGGLVVSILAGTSLAGEPRRWWITASLVAAVAAIVDTWDDFRTGRFGAAPPEVSDFAWEFCVYAFSTLVVAAVARIGYRIRLPGIVRAPFCLVTDLTVRWGPADAVFIIFCGIGTCDV